MYIYRGEFYLKSLPGKIHRWAPREGGSLGIRNALVRPWRTTVGPLGDALGDDHEGEGRSEEGVSVAGDREGASPGQKRRSGDGKMGVSWVLSGLSGVRLPLSPVIDWVF